MHTDLHCPEANQTKKAFERYFHGFQVNSLFKQVTDECTLCVANRRLPKEMKHFSSVTNPSAPGTILVSDILRRSKQFIFVTRDSFSDFVTTSIVQSESSKDLLEGIISTTSTTRRNSEITLRVDNAPGFVSLKKSNELKKLNINLQLSDPTNKNSLAIVDKAIQELERELLKISPDGAPITSSELARATLCLNSRIRNRELSSHEIMFSRDQHTGENISLEDDNLAKSKMVLKNKNHNHSEKSKFGDSVEQVKANAKRGDRVYLKEDGDKHKTRELYVVKHCDNESVVLVKILHAHNPNQATKLGNKDITVKQEDIFLAKRNKPLLHETEEDTLSDLSESDQGKISFQTKPTNKMGWHVFSNGNSSTESDEEPILSDGSIPNNGIHQENNADLVLDHHNMESEQSSESEEEIDVREIFNLDQRTPKKGDVIRFYHREKDKWVQVTLTSNSIPKHGGKYFNFKATDGSIGGVDLAPGNSWTHEEGGEKRNRRLHPQSPSRLTGAALSQVQNLTDVLPLPTAILRQSVSN